MKKTRDITLTALFGAVVFVTTRYVQLPLPSGGYVHIGDAFIYLCACILGTPYAIAAGIIGASLSDLTSGFTVYITATVVIKSILTLFFSSSGDKIITPRNITATVVAGVVGVAGYFVADWIITGEIAAAFANMLFGLAQPVASAIVFVLLGYSLDKSNFKKRIGL